MAALSDWPWLRHPAHAVALCGAGNALSWQALAERIEQLAVGFSQQGVHPGAGVMLKAKSSETALLAYLALLRCGARLLPVNPQLPTTQLINILPDLNLDFALTLEGEADFPVPALQMQTQPGCLSLQWQPDAIATLTLTSGSSGLPKAVAHTFRAHLASAAGVVACLNFHAGESWLLSLPLFHVSGQGIIWRWLLSGGCLVLSGERPLPQALAAASFASLVPTQLWRLLQQPTLPEKLHTVLLGGAAIPEALTAQAEARGLACWCGYGMTETASTLVARRAGAGATVGRALDGHRIRLHEGQIQVRSLALGCGYWRNGELLPLTDDAGWYSTGDRGRWHGEELEVVGRLDNQFFSGGEGIQPEQIEKILLAHPAVSSVFVVPKADSEYGHRPVALLAADAPLPDIAEWATRRLAGFQRPVMWYPLPALHAGGIKISRRQLAEWVAAQATVTG
ncbi:o-succinylbenzoate--CoA ligase [Erwinia oleae]|uniref:o-succinylbenzoate--CoA ligase n=1 Tax=Erwinia oleae TaxID=796334 RepID=UPI0005544E73|nr:o-succinylbenzoate--CoA ligase [Erwinia oleae]